MPKPSKHKSPPAAPWKSWLLPIIIFVAVLAAYWPAFSAGFIWDDDSVLTGNLLIRGPIHLIWFSTQPVDYFPVTYSSLWLEWRLWGANPLGYHVTNILLHALSCIFLWRVFEQLKFPAAWLAALLFAVHPVNVESVAWVAERKNVLAMFFYSLTAWFFIIFAQTNNKRWYVFSVIAFLLSLLAKPAAVAWPLVAFGLLWWSKETQEAPTRMAKKALLRVAPFAALALLLGLVTVWFQTHRAIGTDVVNQHTFISRCLLAAKATWFYLLKALLPYPVEFVYPTWASDLHSWTAFVPLIAFVVCLGIFWRFRRSWSKPVLFAFGYFVFLLLPVLGFADIYFQRFSYVADHWQYFALPAVSVLVAMALHRFKVQYILGPVFVVVLACVSFTHARAFRNSDALWTETLRKNPEAWLALNNLAIVREQAGQIDEAVALNNRSLQVHPDQAEAHHNLGEIFIATGKLDEAVDHLHAAIRINRSYSPAHLTLGTVFRHQGKLPEAIAEYREAIRLDPSYTAAHNNLGCLLALQGNTDEGMVEVQRAIALDPDYADALANLGSLLNEQQKPDQALPFLTRAVALNPDNSDAHLNFGNSLYFLNRIEEAQPEYIKALRLNPSQPLAKYGLANCLYRSGNLDDASKLYQQVVESNPSHAESHYQLGTILLSRKEKQAALEHLREAVRLNPDWVAALNNLAWAIVTDEFCKPTESAQAIRFAQHAVELTHGTDASSLDTLAAAWARSDVYTQATEAARQAMALANQSGRTNLATDIAQRLALYNKRTPYSGQ